MDVHYNTYSRLGHWTISHTDSSFDKGLDAIWRFTGGRVTSLFRAIYYGLRLFFETPFIAIKACRVSKTRRDIDNRPLQQLTELLNRTGAYLKWFVTAPPPITPQSEGDPYCSYCLGGFAGEKLLEEGTDADVNQRIDRSSYEDDLTRAQHDEFQSNLDRMKGTGRFDGNLSDERVYFCPSNDFLEREVTFSSLIRDESFVNDYFSSRKDCSFGFEPSYVQDSPDPTISRNVVEHVAHDSKECEPKDELNRSDSQDSGYHSGLGEDLGSQDEIHGSRVMEPKTEGATQKPTTRSKEQEKKVTQILKEIL